MYSSLIGRAVLVFVFGIQFVEVMYAELLLEPPWAWTLLSSVGFVWVVCSWLQDDSRKREIRWPLDLGMFVYVAWVLVLPYHLLRTRGLAGVIPVMYFILSGLLGSALATIVSGVFLT